MIDSGESRTGVGYPLAGEVPMIDSGESVQTELGYPLVGEEVLMIDREENAGRSWAIH